MDQPTPFPFELTSFDVLQDHLDRVRDHLVDALVTQEPPAIAGILTAARRAALELVAGLDAVSGASARIHVLMNNDAHGTAFLDPRAADIAAKIQQGQAVAATYVLPTRISGVHGTYWHVHAVPLDAAPHITPALPPRPAAATFVKSEEPADGDWRIWRLEEKTLGLLVQQRARIPLPADCANHAIGRDARTILEGRFAAQGHLTSCREARESADTLTFTPTFLEDDR